MMRTCYNLWPGQATGDYAYTLDVQNLFKEVEKEGIDGRKLVNKARKLIKKYEE